MISLECDAGQISGPGSGQEAERPLARGRGRSLSTGCCVAAGSSPPAFWRTWAPPANQSTCWSHESVTFHIHSE